MDGSNMMGQVQHPPAKQVPRVLAAFERLGFKFKLDDFESRLIAQKAVYLLEQLGLSLGYRGTYGYYIRGTYSPTLTKDLFEARSLGILVQPQSGLSHAEEAKVDQLKQRLEIRAHQLEVAAAYRYLTAERGMTPEQALRDIKTNKSFIPEKEIALGISRCKQLFPQQTATDIQALETEMAAWDKASNTDQL
jgi:uncharacterized protein YwgA